MAAKSTPLRPVGRLGPPMRRRAHAAPIPAPAVPHEPDDSAPGPNAELRARLTPEVDAKPVAVPPPTLAEQNSDFTAEGAPPPGKVDTRAPARSNAPDRPKR